MFTKKRNCPRISRHPKSELIAMRITMVLASANQGGLEKHVRELSESLSDNGHQVSVIAPREFLSTLSDKVTKISMYGNLSRYNPILLIQLLFNINQSKPDIIHAQANKAAAMVGYLKCLLNVPIVATIHNLKTRVRSFKAYKHIICVSKQLTQQFDSSKKTTVIYNGIEHQQPKLLNLHARFNFPKNYPVLCAVGRLVEAKGFDLLLNAIDGLPVSLIIIGHGKDREKLSTRIKQLNSNTYCKLLGHRNDAVDLIHSSDALIISSKREGFSYVLNEALLSGTKVLSTDVPIANEVLPSDLIVPINDTIALRQQLIKLLDQKETWAAMMQAPQAFAKKNLITKAMTKNTLSFYEKVIKQYQ